jgi:histone H3/H4
METKTTTKTILQHKSLVSRKKKSHLFETYISKVLKQISEKNGITSNSKQQLNSALCIITKTICSTVLKLTEISKKKTLSDKEVSNAVKIIFSGDLANNAICEGCKSVDKFNAVSSNGSSRQGKAGIIFPPSITEKFLRNFGYSKVMVTSSAPVFLAAVLDYLVAEILILSTKSAVSNKRIRITIRDLEMSIRGDNELSNLFDKLELTFLGGGVIPYIHPYLLSKKQKKKKKVITEICDVKKSHRFRSGTVAIREIKKFQKTSNCLTFARFPFERLVRKIINTNTNGIKISKDVFVIVQYYIEQYIVSILKDANTAAIHTGRVKLMESDIKFICDIRKLSTICLSPLENIENDEGENDEGENDEGENDEGENDEGENDEGENDEGENDEGDDN